MSVTASKQTKEQKESGSVTKSACSRGRKKESKRKMGRNRPLRCSGVNGTAKVYFVEEKAACHATMGPHSGDVGVPRGPRD